jgi:hypothetical protein
MTGTVPLPIVIEALDRVFKRGIIFEEAVHADNFEDIAEKRTHAGKLKIAIEISEQFQALE